MATPEILLTEEQRLEFMQIPPNISEWEIAKYYTFTDNDMEIINRHRRDYNKLGFAVQLCYLRNPGWSFGSIGDIPGNVVSYIAEQLHADPKKLEQYASRENTRLEHLQQLREYYGYRNFTQADNNYLLECLIPYAMESDNAGRLIRFAIEELKKQMVILPDITTIEKIVNEVIQKANDAVIDIINGSLTDVQKCQLDEIIKSPNESTKTTLAFLKEDPGQSSPKAFIDIIEKLEYIRKLGLELKIEGIHPNRLRQLSRLGSKYEPHSFDKNFIHASTGNTAKNEEKGVLMAALMAMGTNIGLVKMADSTPGITYHQMANAVQWRMYDDAMKRAQATLVNYQHKQFLSSYWGDGSTSSSDGMRVQVGVSSLHAEHNPHYGMEKGTTMYRFVSDQFSTFYTKIINTNARDAVHIIDGLLYHETELCIDEHYTDTAGYTDQVFGLSHLLGFRFTPRIRDISELKLYSFSKPSDYNKMP